MTNKTLKIIAQFPYFRFVVRYLKDIFFFFKQNDISGELLNILSDFLSNRKRSVVLNSQNSSWTNVPAGIPQESILGSLLFLIYINDLLENLTSNAQLFADAKSLFSVLHYVNSSARVK